MIDYDAEYFKGLTEATRDFVAELAEVLPRIKGDVLEIGCGMGRALKVLAASGVECKGVDISEHAVKACGELGLHVEKADATALPFADGEFDVAFSMHTLEHVADIGKAIDESVRVARITAIHLVPLGKRQDPTHEHEFAKLESLREKILDATDARPVSFRRLDNDTALVTFDKSVEVTPQDVLAYLPGKELTIAPDFVALVGGAVKKETTADLDILLRADGPFMGAELKIRNLLPEELRDKFHPVYNPAGPHDDHVALYDLVLRPKSIAEVSRIAEKAAIKPLTFFKPLKTSGGYSQQEFFAPSVLWDSWAKAYIEEGQKLDVEEKYNGWRGVLQRDSGGKTLIFFEDTRTNRSKQFPGLVSDLKSIGKAVILDADIGAVHSDGMPVARRFLAGWNKSEGVDKDGGFEIATGEKVHLVVHVFDMLYDGDESLVDLPWSERRKRLEDLVGRHDFRFIKLGNKQIVSTKDQLLSAIRKVSKQPGSEGAVIKVVTSKYPLGGQSVEWSKVKNFVEFKVKILDVHPVKGGGRNFTVGYLDGGEIVRLGKTFNTELKADVGDTITIEASEIVPEKKGDKWRISAVVPRVLKPTTGKPETIDSIIRRARAGGVLQASPKMLGDMRDDGVIEKAKATDDEIELLVCEKCATSTYHLEACECDTCGGLLNEAHVIKAVEGTLDFKEGDKGTGVLQVHERGLTETQAKKLGSFGWTPTEVSDDQIKRLDDIHAAPWRNLIKQAQEGDSAALGRAVKTAMKIEGLTDADRRLLALVDPISVHTDFRLRPEGENYWEGGEAFTPGNQFEPNKIRQLAEGKIPPTAKVLGNLKVPRAGEGRSGASIKGPIVWLKVGDPKPQAFPPGAVGSTSGAWSRFAVVDKFKWRAGIQDRHFKEFEFDGGVLKGRWIFQFVPVDEGRREWMISRPKDQELKADKKPKDDEREKHDRSYFVEIVKAEKRLVTGVVLQPEIVDGQGDVVSDEAIEEGAHKFMEAYYERRAALGVQHKDYSRDLELVESYITPSEMIINGQSVKAGSWIMTIKVNDNEIWKAVKRGELTGLSIKGKVRVIRTTS